MKSIEEQILILKKERKATIIAHNYQLPEIQEIADFTGDSLELSRKAAQMNAKVIVFCGVHFMAETAAILNPDKTVLIPDPLSGCRMADMITADQLREIKLRHPKAKVVCYVNSSAAVKAESDICCTSANAVAIVKAMDKEQEIIFVPDQYLGQFVASRLKRKLILWPGYCPTHANITPADICRLKAIHPQAKVLVHPECRPEVWAEADEVLSTGQMCTHAKQSNSKEFIIGTEEGLLHRLRKENPEKCFFLASERAVCPNMKRNTLEKVLWSLADMQYKVMVDEPIRGKALQAINQMLKLSV